VEDALTSYASYCAVCDERLPDDVERCDIHVGGATYMKCDDGAPFETLTKCDGRGAAMTSEDLENFERIYAELLRAKEKP
jgi:hypothetical protein